jgi:protein-tyrosine phosphatase
LAAPKPEIILQKVQELKEELSQQGIALDILPGADVRISPEMIQNPESMKPYTLNGTGKYFLLEFSDELLPPNPKRLIEVLVAAGIIPIVTHPERNFVLVREPQILWELVMSGALVQVTASSLAGRQGPMMGRYVRSLLEHDLVHFIATDGHSLDNRPPVLSQGFQVAAEILGSEEARALVEDNPQSVIDGGEVPRGLPEPFSGRGGGLGGPPRGGSGWLSRLLGR